MRRLEHRRHDLAARRRPLVPAGAGRALACLLLAGCEVPKEINPVTIYREVTGLSDAGRRPPPGLDDPFPNLASVPPRPDRPAPAARQALSAALAEVRSNSREPLVLRSVPAGPGAAMPMGAAGQPGMPAEPPSRPVFAAVPRVPWGEAPAARPRDAAGGRAVPDQATARPEPQLPEMPDTAPAAPPPDLLRAPGPGLSGAPPPPPADLLAPRPR